MKETIATKDPRECPCVLNETPSCVAGDRCFHFGGDQRCEHCGQQDLRRKAPSRKSATGAVTRLEWLIGEIEAALKDQPSHSRVAIRVSRDDVRQLRRVWSIVTGASQNTDRELWREREGAKTAVSPERTVRWAKRQPRKRSKCVMPH